MIDLAIILSLKVLANLRNVGVLRCRYYTNSITTQSSSVVALHALEGHQWPGRNLYSLFIWFSCRFLKKSSHYGKKPALLVSASCYLIACSGRKCKHTDTHLQTKYCNPQCACMLRVNKYSYDYYCLNGRFSLLILGVML